MNVYIDVVKQSFVYFPLVALLFTIPYILMNYHKYGSIFSIRILVVYSFILYMMTTYFLVILPLPSIEEVAKLSHYKMQLQPFQFVFDIIKEAHKTGGFTLLNRAFLQVAFNVLMTIPFGIYLRYYFKCDLKKTFMYSFLLTLFFELTQLSGLYFIYPKSYRVFDVDDLFANTLGGLIGYFIAKPLTLILPDRDHMDQSSYHRGMNVSLLRRLSALGIDNAFLIIVDGLCGLFFSVCRDNAFEFILISISLYFGLVPLISNGQTIGQWWCNLKVKSTKSRITHRYQQFIRFAFNQLMFFFGPFCLLSLTKILDTRVLHGKFRLEILCLVIGIVGIGWIFDFCLLLLRKRPFAERISKTRMVSTILENPYNDLID